MTDKHQNSRSIERRALDDDLFAVSRSDLVASVEAFRLGSQTRSAWAPLAGAFLSMLGGAVGATAASLLGWPYWLQPAFFFAGIGASLAFGVSGIRQHRRLVARTQWECPHCSTPLIAASGINPLARAEVAIASGRCPSCGEPLFNSEQLGASS